MKIEPKIPETTIIPNLTFELNSVSGGNVKDYIALGSTTEVPKE